MNSHLCYAGIQIYPLYRENIHLGIICEKLKGFNVHPNMKELVKETEYPTTTLLCQKPYKLNL